LAVKILVEFQGTVISNPYNVEDYKIYGLKVDYEKFPDIKENNYKNVSLVGDLPDLENGIEYTIKAEEQNGKNGVQYKFINIKRDIPKSELSTRLFLQSILDSHNQVDEIMREYPDIIERVLNDKLDDIDLNKLYNIGKYRLNVIKKKIIENFALAELVTEFKGFIEFKVLKILYDKYGSIDLIKEKLQNDPYKCLCGISRIGFKTADKILLQFNKECIKMKQQGENPPIDFTFDLQTSSQRQKSAIMYLLEENESNGNTKIDIKTLKKQSETIAKKCIEHFIDIIKNDENIYIDKKDMTVALKTTYDTEKYIADRILDGLKIINQWDIDTTIYRNISDDISLTDQQFEVLNMLCKSNICILNGFSGSGKSQTTNSVIKMLKDNKKSFCLFAPTGRAAKVLAEYANNPASTIHRGLAYMPPEWGYNEKCKLPYNVVIVDEFGMCDVFLMKHLLEAIDFNKTKLLMIGDSAQIPSISAGNVFYDLIGSSIIPLISLTQIFRYGEGGILTVATKTRNCEIFLTDSLEPQIFGKDKSYIFLHTPQNKIINRVVKMYNKLLHKGCVKEDIMVLSTYNIGDYGTLVLNKYLQPVSNDNVKNKKKYIQIGDIKFYENDMVMQTANNYKAIRYNEEYINEDDKTFVANGEIGTIINIEYNKVIIQFDEIVIYDKNDLINVKLAYSIGTIKSQGGQAKIVIMITPKAHTYMLNSNLIYVAQTRAKQKVFHFGEIETVNRAIKKKADFNRKTYLKEILNKG